MEEQDGAEYQLLIELEQLETLKEEMEEVGVTNLAEIEERMSELNQRLDELHDED